MTQPTKIKTNIKFSKGLDNREDRLYGFVTKIGGSWRGCRGEAERKKIVFVDTAIAKDVVPNVLYSCSLVPMRKEGGFIAKSATVVKFKGVIRTICRKDVFVVSVKFGNRIYSYNPSNDEEHKNNIQRIANALRNRIDLVDAYNVAEDFINAACMVKHMYNQSAGHVH